MVPKAFLFVCGPHTSGKTSVISALQAQGLIGYAGPEIGKKLFYERRLKTAEQGVAFEHEILQLELARDQQLYAFPGVSVVETWHPGNVAYAAIRNPGAVSDLIRLASSSPVMGMARGLWLRVPRQVIRQRTRTFADNPDWAAEFYGQIDERIGFCLEGLGLRGSTTEVDASVPFNDVLVQVKQWLRGVTGS